MHRLACTGPVRVPFCLRNLIRNRLDGGTDGEGQRFPFTHPVPGSPANKTLDFSVYEPMSYFPGYDIHNKLPYAEHFNFSIQRELSKSTVLTLAYVGTEGHRLISQSESNPGDAALCLQLAAQGAGCGPNGEQNFYTVGANTIYGTRDKLLNPNYCPGAQSLCFGFGNTFTKLVANSIYNAGEVTVERRAGDVTFLAAYTFAKALDNASGFNDLVNFANPKLSRGLSSTDVQHNFVISYIWELPFFRLTHALPRLTKGWQLQGITRFATGFPIQMGDSNPIDASQANATQLCPGLLAQPNPIPCVGDSSLAGSPSTDMPNVVGPVHIQNPRSTPGTFTYFNQSAFVATNCYFDPITNAPSPDCGTFGTANRRFFHGPGVIQHRLGNFEKNPGKRSNVFRVSSGVL